MKPKRPCATPAGDTIDKYGNLQDLVGMSFDECADAIGVLRPATAAHIVFQSGFE